jgi:uncharacterized protein YjiK
MEYMNLDNYDGGMVNAFIITILLVNLSSCLNTTGGEGHSNVNSKVSEIGYNLSEPDKTIPLPLVLNEISGITVVSSSSVACVQDEDGIIFIVDITGSAIKNEFTFQSDGDYEGITMAGKAIYVLRSDGELYQVSYDGSAGSLSKIFSVGIPPLDNEGLCYDRNNNRLLIVSKNNAGKYSEIKGKHPVFGFDLDQEILLEEPVLSFNIPEIKKFAEENDIQPAEGDGKIGFRPSAIGIHPLTNKLYVLSAMERILCVFNMNGTIEYIEKLNPKLFNMPEGITFLPNGDMLISNEGRINPPTILRFNYNLK